MEVMKTAEEALWSKRASSSVYGIDGVTTKKKQTPLLNRVYFARTRVMHVAVEKSINTFYQNYGRTSNFQILSLGGGLDESFHVYSSNYYVVDFPLVINQRYDILCNNKEKLGICVGEDLANFSGVISALETQGFDRYLPTIVLLECVLSYLDEDVYSNLLRSLSSYLLNGVLISYDPMLDTTNEEHSRAYALKMFDRFASKGAPIPSTKKSTFHAMMAFAELNWKHTISLTMFQAMHLVLQAHERSAEIVKEPFDEFHSYQLLLNLYGVTISTNVSYLLTTFWNSLPGIALVESLPEDERQRLLSMRLQVAMNRTAVLCCLKNKQPIKSSLSNISIEEAQVSHCEDISAVYKKAFEKYCKEDVSVAKYIKFAAKELQSNSVYFKEDSSSKLLVAVMNDSHRVCGSVGVKVCMKQDQQRFEICHVCVDDEMRGQGIGKKLMEQALLYCKTMNATSIDLSVMEKLTAARNLYDKLGFETEKVHAITDTCSIYHMVLIPEC